ncbi:MAG: WYL domain-containing protein, partial [Trebonia sp.]
APLRGDPPLALSDVLTVDNRGWFAADESPDVASLARDLRLARRLRIRYRHSGAAESQVYVVDPYGLLLRADRWYLIADSESRPRMYALTRLEHWELLAETRRLRAGATLAGTAAELRPSREPPPSLAAPSNRAGARPSRSPSSTSTGYGSYCSSATA